MEYLFGRSRASLEGDLFRNNYHFRHQTHKDVVNALTNFRELRTDVVCSLANDGTKRISLYGTIPIIYKESNYNIPIRLLLQTDHPYRPPICYVIPTQTMVINVSTCVDQSGLVYLPYLYQWAHPPSNLTDLIQVMCIVFAESPPVCSRPIHSSRAAPSLSTDNQLQRELAAQLHFRERPMQREPALHRAIYSLPSLGNSRQSPVSSGLLTDSYNQMQQEHAAVVKERKEKEELQQKLQQEQENRDNIQKELDEARHQMIQICKQQEHELREKANIAEQLSDAEQVIERNKVLNIPSHDIELTDTELGRGSYGGKVLPLNL